MLTVAQDGSLIRLHAKLEEEVTGTVPGKVGHIKINERVGG